MPLMREKIYMQDLISSFSVCTDLQIWLQAIVWHDVVLNSVVLGTVFTNYLGTSGHNI